MKSLTLSEIASAVHGKFIGNDGSLTISNVAIDSRLVNSSTLFIAIKGERFDAHDFIPSVFNAGAVCAISEKEIDTDSPYILVESTLQALKDLAMYYRSILSAKVIGVTGSVGKTTTKEIIAAVLEQKYSVLKTAGNLNNEIGLPMTIFGMNETHDIAVLEMGMNHFHEIENLSKVAKPDVCVITNIGVAHIENLGSREGILKAKTEMFLHMKENADIILNGDDDMLQTLRGTHENISFVGVNDCNDVVGKNIHQMGLKGTNCDLVFKNKTLSVHIPSPGIHMVNNALVAAAVGDLFSLNDQEIVDGIAGYVPAGSRMNIIDTGNILIIDDVYNANPVSMKSSIDVLKSAHTRTVCILGDMFELGDKAKEYHFDVGQYAVSKNVDLIICIGKLAKEYFNGANASNQNSRILWYKDIDAFSKDGVIQKGDTVLVKASRGMHFERVVELLKNT